MSSETEICSLALRYLGQNPILNLIDPKSTIEQLCAMSYPIALKTTLELAKWSFATERFVAESTQRDAWDTQYVHTLPEGLLKVFDVYSSVSAGGVHREAKGWSVQGDLLATTQAKVYGVGVLHVKDPNRFTGHFTTALTLRLAADMAIAVTESRSMHDSLYLRYEAAVDEAIAVDADQSIQVAHMSSAINNSRF